MLILGGVIGLAGLAGLIFSLTSTGRPAGSVELNYEHALRVMVPSVTALTLSCQAVLGCFFLSILGIKQARHTTMDAVVAEESSDEHVIAAI